MGFNIKCLLLFLLFYACTLKVNAQEALCIKNVSDEAAANITKELSGFLKKDKKSQRQLLVMPVYDNQGNNTALGRQITARLAQELNSALKNEKIQMSVRTYEELKDTSVTKTLEQFRIASGDENAFYTDLLEKLKPDFLLQAEYGIDERSKQINISYIRIFSNFMDNKQLTKLTPEDASAYIPEEDFSYIKDLGATIIKGEANIDFVAFATNQPDKDSRTDQFYDGNSFYVYFISPIKGYIAVYDDIFPETYSLIPTKEMLLRQEYSMPVESDREYILFADKKYKTRTERDTEINNLYVIFSTDPLTKPFFKDTGGSMSIAKSEVFHGWKDRLSKTNKNVQIQKITLKINQK